MKTILAGIVAMIAASSPSLAADLTPRPYVKAPSAVLAAYDWSGLYAGLNAGYGTTDQCWSTPGTPSLGCNTASGALAGGQIGYRWQFNQWVIGLEAQGDWANLKGSHPDPFGPAFDLTETKGGFGIFSAQLGYGINNTLIYVKGGGAVSSVHYDAESLRNPLFSEGTGNLARWNGMVGAGFEYGFSRNWSAGLEYNRIFSNRFDERLFRTNGFNEVAYIKGDIDLVTARINYHFH